MGVHLLDDLPAVMEGYKKQIFTTVTRIAQRAALAAGDYLARETPVDTGVARSNWVGTIEEPFMGIIPAYAPYPTYRQNHHESVKSLNVSRTSKKLTVISGRP